MPTHWGASTWIEIDGVRTEEFKVTIEGSLVKCYIASEAGKSYKIKSACLGDIAVGFDARAIVDGNKHRAMIVGSGRTTSNAGPRDELGRILPYQFAPALLTDDDDAVTATEHDIKSLGEIRVEVRRYASLGEIIKSAPNSGHAIRQPPVIHELSKKAQFKHTSSFGAPQHKPSSTQQMTMLDRTADPAWLTFVFTYRSRDQLEAEGIIAPAPRPPSPHPAPAAAPAPRPIPSAADRREEKEALRKRLRELEDDDEIAVVPKREAKPKIKPEPVAGPSRPAKRQVIDLTLDD